MEGTNQRIRSLESTVVDLQKEVDVANSTIHEYEKLIEALEEVAEKYDKSHARNETLEDANHFISEDLKEMTEKGMENTLPTASDSNIILILDRIKLENINSTHAGLTVHMYIKIIFEEARPGHKSYFLEFTSQTIECVDGNGKW